MTQVLATKAKSFVLMAGCLAGISFQGTVNMADAHGARAAKQGTYRHYFNDKYSYSIDYPDYLIAGEEPDAQDGVSFASQSKPLKMKVWGCYSNWMNGEEMTLAQEREWALKHLASDDLPAPKVTYQAQGKNWFVISGTSSGNVFYQRTIKEGDSFATVFITYPVASKTEFDAAVNRIALSLKG